MAASSAMIDPIEFYFKQAQSYSEKALEEADPSFVPEAQYENGKNAIELFMKVIEMEWQNENKNDSRLLMCYVGICYLKEIYALRNEGGRINERDVFECFNYIEKPTENELRFAAWAYGAWAVRLDGVEEENKVLRAKADVEKMDCIEKAISLQNRITNCSKLDDVNLTDLLILKVRYLSSPDAIIYDMGRAMQIAQEKIQELEKVVDKTLSDYEYLAQWQNALGRLYKKVNRFDDAFYCYVAAINNHQFLMKKFASQQTMERCFSKIRDTYKQLQSIAMDSSLEKQFYLLVDAMLQSELRDRQEQRGITAFFIFLHNFYLQAHQSSLLTSVILQFMSWMIEHAQSTLMPLTNLKQWLAVPENMTYFEEKFKQLEKRASLLSESKMNTASLTTGLAFEVSRLKFEVEKMRKETETIKARNGYLERQLEEALKMVAMLTKPTESAKQASPKPYRGFLR